MSKFVDVGSIGSYFESLSDPRHIRNRKHLLVDIAVIAVCGIICGCDGPTAIHRQGQRISNMLYRQDLCQVVCVEHAGHHLSTEAVLVGMALQQGHGEAA